ncbi:MAG: TetR/AcrR family transcriptional regulator [Streptosporangiaceae bacterium]
MPRTKEFDPDAALDAAMVLFWRNGYEATSMADLVEHLGIGKASLYGTFGNKHELYLKALARYVETRDPSPVEMLSQPGPVLPAVRALVESYARGPGADQAPGCMVVNAAVECCPDDTQVERQVTSSWDALEVALTSALTRARAQGEISADKGPRSLARFLLVVLQGMQVVGRSGRDTARLSAAARQALEALA